MKITDEVREAASRAAEDAYRRWHATPNRDAYVSGFIAAAAKGAIEAAAPLIAAQALREFGETIASRAAEYRGEPFRSGRVGIEFIDGLEAAGEVAEQVATALGAPSGGPTGGTPE